MGVPATVIVLLGMLALLIAAEHVRPARTFDEVPGWKLKCLAFIPLVVGVAASIPYLMAGLIDGVDIDARMVASARRNAASAGVDIAFREADMTCLPELERGSYDRVYSTMTFHHLLPRAKQKALELARCALVRGGSFVVADFNRPRDLLQWALFAWIQQPLDGFHNTRPHRDGRFEQAVRATFGQVHSAAVARTIAGTVETFVCAP